MVFDLDQQARASRDPRRFACGPQIGRDPRKHRPAPVIFACSSITLMIGRLWRLPASKSFGSCAGVIFTTPVPNSGSAISSRMIGISRFISGRRTVLAVKVTVALVLRIDRDAGVAEHRFGPRRGHDQLFVACRSPDKRCATGGPASPRARFRDRRSRSGSEGTSSPCTRRDKSGPFPTAARRLRERLATGQDRA